jgi:hypothetical protein
MRRRPPRAAALVAFLLLAFSPLAAQAAPAPEATRLPSLDPKPSENPLGRFEIVSLGSYPLALFYVDFAFDLQRYFANGTDPAYAPWPFKSSYSPALSESERLTRLGVALGFSFAVGAIDAYIHASKARAAKRLREAMLSVDSSGQAAPPGTPAGAGP